MRKHLLRLVLLFSVVIICLLSLCSCLSQALFRTPRKSYAKVMNSSMDSFAWGTCAMDENGLFLFMQEDKGNSALSYLCPNAEKSIVCWNPGCSHSKELNPDCPALFLENGERSVLCSADNAVYILQNIHSFNYESIDKPSTETIRIWEINLAKRTKSVIWEYSFSLESLWQSGISQYCLFDNYLYILRTETKQPEYKPGPDGSIKAEREMNRFIQKIDLSTKKVTTLYSRMNEFTDILLIGMTKDYILMTENNQETQLRHYRRLSLKDQQMEDIITCDINEGCVFMDDSTIIYAERDDGRTAFYQREIHQKTSSKLGEIDAEYYISFFDAFQARMAKLGFISIKTPDNNLLQDQLFYDWIDDCLRKPEEGNMIQEKDFNDEYISIQFGPIESMENVLIASMAEAHARIAELLPEVESD